MRSSSLNSILGLAVIAVLATAPAAAQEGRKTPVDPIVAAANDLGFALAPKLATEGNSFFSSASVTSALLMAYAGSRGETAAEIAEVLHLVELEPTSDRLDRAVATLIESLNRRTSDERIARRRRFDPDYEGALQLKLVNAFWGQTGHPFRADYLRRLSGSYGSALHELDFAADPEAARRTINERIAKDTQDKIRDLLPEDAIDAQSLLVLTNAIYFKNSWADPFSKRATRPQSFELGADRSVEVPMMRRQGGYQYVEDELLRAVRIPYAEGRQSMLVVLPTRRHDLASVEKALDRKRLDGVLRTKRSEQIGLELPRFKIEQSFELRDALIALGMKRAFSSGLADFGGIDDGAGQLFIARAIHKTFVDVDEKGTEAAAATALVMKRGSARPAGEPIPFVCDQPFLFFIVDDATGLVLFQGRCADPRN